MTRADSRADRPVKLLLLLALCGGCVLDRTGQSATAAYERELALQKNRADEMERLNTDLERRIAQIEEVNRYRGQQEAEKMENLDQVRAEVRRIRGDLETFQHTTEESGQQGEAFRDDATFRMDYLEQRVAALEKSLGVKPPPPPVPGQNAGVTVSNTGEVKTPERPPAEVEIPSSPEAMLELAETQLREGKPKVARAVLERFIAENPQHARVVEARYRYAETYFNEGQFQTAILRFEDVVSNGGDSPWVPWAMVRQGECFKALGKDAEAKLFWEDVLTRYPKSKAAVEAKRLLGK